jgi:putative peptidoglycan lipid II flippase
MFKNMLPVLIVSGITHINLWVGTIIATTVSGAVSVIYYAERLNQFPLAIIGTAMGTILLPTISKNLKERNFKIANELQNQSIKIALFLTVPCSFAFFSVGDLIIATLFQRNAFEISDTLKVSQTLSILSIGLPAFVMVKIFAPRFFAELDTKTPVNISIISIFVNLVLSSLLVESHQFLGIAFASIISGWCNFIILFIQSLRKKYFNLDKSLLVVMAKILICCCLMNTIIFELRYILNIHIEDTQVERTTNLLILVVTGITSYFIMSYMMKIVNPKEIRAIFRKA